MFVRSLQSDSELLFLILFWKVENKNEIKIMRKNGVLNDIQMTAASFELGTV